MVVAHDRSNLDHGVGARQDPDVLYGPEDVVADLDPTGLAVRRVERVRRSTDQAGDASPPSDPGTACREDYPPGSGRCMLPSSGVAMMGFAQS
jgi:hypothetical protein